MLKEENNNGFKSFAEKESISGKGPTRLHELQSSTGTYFNDSQRKKANVDLSIT